jgi:hypothetical protein
MTVVNNDEPNGKPGNWGNEDREAKMVIDMDKTTKSSL